MRRHETGRGSRRIGPRTAFTLIELLIVVVIIGILFAFILNAAMDGIRRAEERSTQALIAKIESGLNDRLQALLAQSVEPNDAHHFLAATWNGGIPPVDDAQSRFFGLRAVPSKTRAQTIAKIDYIKAEMPDVFVVQDLGNAGLNGYPFNFGGGAYPGSPALAGPGAAHAPYLLPIGAGMVFDPMNTLGGGQSFGAARVSPPASMGVYGASYAAASGLLKQLYNAALRDNPGIAQPTPPNRGFDGVDNDGDGLIDELDENGKEMADAMYARLRFHRHKTARSAMLYALLVEGQGPLGSVFSPDDFRDNEVADTDGDGLLEFVDAWGEPLQFFRWPIFYQSDAQRGFGLYRDVIEARDQNPLDPNQLLMSPSWWGASFNSDSPYSVPQSFGASPMSQPAGLFQALFFSLTDPNAQPSLNPVAGRLWDRGVIGGNNSTYPRRAYFSRFLVLSGGPDKVPGVPVLDAEAMSALGEYSSSGFGSGPSFSTPLGYNDAILRYLRIESQAAPFGPDRTPDFFMASSSADGYAAPLAQVAGDDISNHNLQAPGGATQ